MVYQDRKELTFWLSDEATRDVLAFCCGLFGEPEISNISDAVFGTRAESVHGCFEIGKDRWYRTRRHACSWDVALERKTQKRRGTTLKKAIIPFSDLARLERDYAGEPWAGKWFHRQIYKHQLQQILQLNFQRTTFQHTTLEGPIRLTVDSNAGTQMLAGSQDAKGCDGLETKQPLNLVSMKYCVALPVAFKTLLYDFSLLPDRSARYSKYLQMHHAQQQAIKAEKNYRNVEVATCLIG